MIGALIGDIVGSIYEFNNHRSKDFEFYGKDCSFTDDSVMSLAICDAILESDSAYSNLYSLTIKNMKYFGRKYPYESYGINFSYWLFSDNSRPYNSFGNGSAMRVAGCGFAANSLQEAIDLATITAEVTHNHPEGIKGARATAAAIYLAKTGKSKQEILDYIKENFYKDIPLDLDKLRKTYVFNETCQDTVPQAIGCFIESTDFEDAIRNAISVGGDSDTLACITGGIAEAFYGVPEDLRKGAEFYLDEFLLNVLRKFEARYQ